MTAPTPPIPSFTDGLIVHANQLNALGANLTNLYNFTMGGFLNAPPFCIATQTVAQAIPNNANTAMTMNTTIVNNTNMWVASQPTQLTAQVAGTYLMWAQVFYAANSTGQRQINISVNGTASSNFISGFNVPALGSQTLGALGFYRLSVGGTITGLTLQSSGGSLNTATGTALNSSLAALWLGP